MSAFDKNYPHLGGDGPQWTAPGRGNYHPAAELMPMMNAAEAKALGESIQLHGLREPIAMLDGKILDGRNRYLYLTGLGKTLDKIREMKTVDGRPAITDLPDMSDGEALTFVLDHNLNRRHLTSEQKKDLIDKLVSMYGVRDASRPKKSTPNGVLSPTQAEIAKMTGTSTRTVSRVVDANKEEAAQAEAEGREPLPPSQRPKTKTKTKTKAKPDTEDAAVVAQAYKDAEYIIAQLDADESGTYFDAFKVALIAARPVLKARLN